MKRNGVALRGACDGCSGKPTHGQRTLRRGDVVYLGGEPADSMYCVVEGFLKESQTTADGRTVGIRLVRAGELVGTEALTSDCYQCTVEALAPARVCRVPMEDVNRALESDAAQGRAVGRALSLELQRVRESMMTLVAMNAEEKVRAMLEELLGTTPAGQWICLPVSRQEISEFLGLALATVSRTVRRLERDGAFEVSGRNIRRL